MFKTVVNFRHDRGRLSIDSHLTCKWDSTLVDAAATIREVNPAAVAVLYANANESLVEGMKQLVRAEQGMRVRRAMDSAIEGPFVLDHEEPMTDKELIAWFKAKNARKRSARG